MIGRNQSSRRYVGLSDGARVAGAGSTGKRPSSQSLDLEEER